MRFSTISARFGHQLATFFFQGSLLQETSKTAYFLSRLLVSVDIGLVCMILSWRRGMRFSPIPARFGHQLATGFFSMLVFAGDIKNSVFFV